jgi:hypothetical protein
VRREHEFIVIYHTLDACCTSGNEDWVPFWACIAKGLILVLVAASYWSRRATPISTLR